MKNIKRIIALCVCVAILMCGAFVRPSIGVNIVPWYHNMPEHCDGDYSFLYPCIEVYSDYISWDDDIFVRFYESCIKDDYLGRYVWGNWDESRMDGIYKTPTDNTFDISADKAEMTDSVTLCFDYTASVDLATDENGKNTYHAFLVLLYQIVDDAESEYAERDGRFYGCVDGYQVVKYVAPRTADGEKLMEYGEAVTVSLPDNFDPAKHLIGYTMIRIEDKAIEYKETYPGSPYMTFEIDSSAANIKLLDLSKYIDNKPEPPVTEPEPNPSVTTESEPEPEPEPEPTPIRGDANRDGVLNLSDVTVTMKYIAEWGVDIYYDLADVNRNSLVGLEDVSLMLKLIAGWNV